jgi:hypothetical protein
MILALSLLACSAPDAPKTRAAPSEDFLSADTVRVTTPANGDTINPSFVLAYEAGADVDSVRLYGNGVGLGAAQRPADGAGEYTLRLDDGRWALRLSGFDVNGDETSHHDLTVRVNAGGTSWVTIVSPADGANVTDPVSIVVDASDDVDSVELLADGAHIGETTPGGMVSWSTEGTGYGRDIEAVAYVGGVEVASDHLTITVEPGTSPTTSTFNDLVMDYLATYPTDGSYGYYWPEDDGVWYGTTRDVSYRGTLMSPGDAQHRSYCVGLTWELFMRAFDELDRSTGGDGTVNGMSVSDMVDFRTDWFVRDLYGDGVVSAVENYGIGERVTNLEDVRPGDFLQFWRNSGSGHSNVFIQWERDDADRIIGVTYWSVQSSTGGIDYNTEYFGSGGSSVDPSYFFAARVYPPEDWISWR